MEYKEIHVSEPWFSYIKNKKKRIEGRLDKGTFSQLRKKEIITVFNKELNQKFNVEIIKIVKYKSFEEYLLQEGLKRTLPNIRTIEDGIKIYRQFYTKEDENKYGILAIYIRKI
jgi:ASC-1-like (ASCH) protein